MKPTFLASVALLAWATLTTPGSAATRPSGLSSRDEVPALLSVLKNPEASVQQKALACQQLAIFGTTEAIPLLAGFLDHPQLAAQARNVLQNLPGPEASAALRSSLPRLQGPFLVGVINTLGIRRDAEAVAPLLALEKNALQGFWPETLLALGRIASPAARDALRRVAERGPFDQKPAAAEACVLTAEAMLQEGDRSTAVAFFDLARKMDAAPRPVQLAAQRGAILARGDEGIPMLLDLFRSADLPLHELAARTARELSGPAVSHALALELGRSVEAVQVLILGALSDRAEPGLAHAVEPLAASKNSNVRFAAIQALGTLGTAANFPTLLRVLANPAQEFEAAEVEAAANSLSRLPGPETDTAILKALPQGSAPVRARLSRILGYRHSPGATDALVRQAADRDPEVSKAAFDALAAVATLDELPKVIPVAVQPSDDSVRDRAERSVYGICLKQPDARRRSEPLALAFEDIRSVPARASLLQIMAMLGDSTASVTIAKACEDPAPETRDTALRLLVNWPDASPVPTLLRIYKTTPNDVHRTLALRGIVTLSTLWAGDTTAGSKAVVRRPPPESVAWLTEANAALRNQPDEKKIMLSGLGDLNCEAGLQLLRPYLDDPAVRGDAESAALRAIQGISSPEERASARPILEKIAESSPDPDARRKAREALGSTPAKP